MYPQDIFPWVFLFRKLSQYKSLSVLAILPILKARDKVTCIDLLHNSRGYSSSSDLHYSILLYSPSRTVHRNACNSNHVAAFTNNNRFVLVKIHRWRGRRKLQNYVQRRKSLAPSAAASLGLPFVSSCRMCLGQNLCHQLPRIFALLTRACT